MELLGEIEALSALQDAVMEPERLEELVRLDVAGADGEDENDEVSVSLLVGAPLAVLERLDV